jgi:hypothetical protein
MADIDAPHILNENAARERGVFAVLAISLDDRRELEDGEVHGDDEPPHQHA